MIEENPYSASAVPPGENKVVSPAELYSQVTLLRRQDVCSKIIVAHIIAMIVVGYLPILFPVGLVTTIGVIVVCIVVLTGPVYMPHLDYKRGELAEWGIGNKVAAVIILFLFVGGYGLLAYLVYFWK